MDKRKMSLNLKGYGERETQSGNRGGMGGFWRRKIKIIWVDKEKLSHKKLIFFFSFLFFITKGERFSY